jgi:hypothetical protein
MICAKTKLFDIERLRDFSTRVFLYFGCPKEDAEQAADVLSCADLEASTRMALLDCTAISRCFLPEQSIPIPKSN